MVSKAGCYTEKRVQKFVGEGNECLRVIWVTLGGENARFKVIWVTWAGGNASFRVMWVTLAGVNAGFRVMWVTLGDDFPSDAALLHQDGMHPKKTPEAPSPVDASPSALPDQGAFEV